MVIATWTTANGTLTAEFTVASTRPTTHLGVPTGYITKPTNIINGNLTVADGQHVTGVQVNGTVVVQDGGKFTNSWVAGPASGGATTLLTILDGTRGLVEDVTVIPQTPWPRSPSGLRMAGGTARRMNIGFVGDCVAFIRNTCVLEDTLTHDQIMVVSPSQAGGYSHDDALQIHGGSGHKVLRCTLNAYLTPLYGEAGKPAVYNGTTYVSGNPSYPDLHAMSGIMVTPITTPTITNIEIRDTRINGGAAAINLGALGTGPGGGYSLGTIATTTFNTDQGNHPYLAMIGNPALPVTLDRNYYTDGKPAVITRS